MTNYDFSRVYEIFRGAVALESDVRSAYLQAACEGHTEVQEEVEALLEKHEPDSSAADSVVGAMVVDALASSVPDRIADFRIEGVLGAGGMGVVYRAVQEHPHRTVAVKALHHWTGDTLNARFQKESEALGRLRHRGIAQIYSAGTVETETGPLSYFVMELVDGPDLMTYREANRLSPTAVLELTAEICDAVEYAHDEGVIHRDLKPGNILVDRDGTPKVLDFGVARIVDSDAGTVTEAGVVVGTVSYMSPEQASSRADDIGPWSDVYSIGVMLYEMLAGRRPIELHDLSIPEAVSLVATADPVPLERLDPRFSGDVAVIVGKALAKNPEHRYRSAVELADDIRRYLDHEPIVARPPTRIYYISRFIRRHRLAVAIVAILAISVPVVAGLGGFIWARLPDLREHEVTMSERRLENELEIAFHDFHDKKTEEAARRFARILRDHPDSKEALAGEAFARFYLDQDERVLELVAEGERRFGKAGTLTKIKADVIWRAGRKEEARRISLTAAEPTESAEWFIEGFRDILKARQAGKLTADGQNHYRRAEENLVRSIASSDAPRRAYYFALAEAIGSQNKERMDLDFHKVLVARWPDSDRAWWWAAYVSTDANSSMAIEYYEEFLRRRPGDMEVHNNLGIVLRNLGRDDEAEVQYRRAMEIDPLHINPRFNLGRLQESRGDLEGAAELYRGVLENHPNDARTHSELAGVYHKMNRLDDAIVSIRKAVDLDPLIIGAHRNRGIIASDLGLHDEAISSVREAVHLDAADAHSHSVLSDVLRAAGRIDESVAALELSVRLDPSSAIGQSNLAAAYIGQHRYPEAAEAAHKAVKLNPARPAAHLNLGSALSNLGRTKEALEAFKKCLELDPGHRRARKEYEKHVATLGLEAAAPAVLAPGSGETGKSGETKSIQELMDRGMTALRQGRNGEAAVAYRRAIEIAPKNVRAHFMLAHSLTVARNLEGALAVYDKALELDPDHVQSGYQRAALLTDMKRIPESEAAYREMIRRHPEHPESHCNLGSLLRDLGELEEAAAMYRRGHELGSALPKWKYPSAVWVENTVLALARDLASKDELERAVDILEEYEDVLPDRPKLARERRRLERDL